MESSVGVWPVVIVCFQRHVDENTLQSEMPKEEEQEAERRKVRGHRDSSMQEMRSIRAIQKGALQTDQDFLATLLR
jgi:hypothetical protein